jgi:hypothetical protein
LSSSITFESGGIRTEGDSKGDKLFMAQPRNVEIVFDRLLRLPMSSIEKRVGRRGTRRCWSLCVLHDRGESFESGIGITTCNLYQRATVRQELLRSTARISAFSLHERHGCFPIQNNFASSYRPFGLKL